MNQAITAIMAFSIAGNLVLVVIALFMRTDVTYYRELYKHYNERSDRLARQLSEETDKRWAAEYKLASVREALEDEA